MSINNRQQNNGRRRGRSSSNPRQSGGQSRNYDQGNRIDSRARGNATQLLEKYRNMARDAQLSGDRVMTEYYLQFADHYFRVLSDARVRQEEQRGRGDDQGDGGQSDNEGDDQAEELDAIDMIGRAPRNIQGRARREEHGQREPREGRDRGDARDSGRGEERSERQPRDDRGDARSDTRGSGRGRERYDNQDAAGNRERGGNGRDTLRNEGRNDGRNDGRNGSHEDDASFGIDVAVLPPAIGIEPTREVSATPSDAGEAEAAPKRRGRPRKLVAEGEATEG